MNFIFSPTATALLVLLTACFLTQVLYYGLFYSRILWKSCNKKSDASSITDKYPSISIIITSKDDIEQLRANLPSILEQDYPNFEVIVIKEGKNVDAEELLGSLEEKYKSLYHSFVPDSSRYISKKKLAITIGIKASRYEWLVFTNSNCHPISKDWLKSLAVQMTDSTEIILGYSGYEFKKGFLQKIISYDNLIRSIRFMSMGLAKHPYMGYGRNMAFRKDLFFNSRGFSDYLNLESGYDDLFINQVAKGTNTKITLDTNSIIHTEPFENRRMWMEERMTYTVTSKHYRGVQKYLMGWDTFTRLMLWISGLFSIYWSITQHTWILLGITIAFIFIHLIIQEFIINSICKKLQERRRYYFSLPFLMVLQPVRHLWFKIKIRMTKKREFLRRSC